jgi:hypothetical protein
MAEPLHQWSHSYADHADDPGGPGQVFELEAGSYELAGIPVRLECLIDPDNDTWAPLADFKMEPRGDRLLSSSPAMTGHRMVNGKMELVEIHPASEVWGHADHAGTFTVSTPATYRVVYPANSKGSLALHQLEQEGT